MNKEEMRHKIDYEIIVDAYDDYEINMSWYYFFEEAMEFPFPAETVMKFRNGEKRVMNVEVLGLVDNNDFEQLSEVLFEVSPLETDAVFEVRISQLKKVKGSREVREAFELWHFWKSDGY